MRDAVAVYLSDLSNNISAYIGRTSIRGKGCTEIVRSVQFRSDTREPARPSVCTGRLPVATGLSVYQVGAQTRRSVYRLSPSRIDSITNDTSPPLTPCLPYPRVNP